MTVPYVLDGMTWIEHEIDVPLDPSLGEGPTLRVFAREVVPVGGSRSLPALLFLQGGPGGASPRPRAKDGWIGAALAAGFRVVLLDQRGTGRSAPIDPALPPDDDEACAAHLARFRADAIVADAERLRVELLGPDGRWTLLGQSFGGFVALHYLSVAPDALAGVMITGGLPSLGRPALDVYRACFEVLERKTGRFAERHPREVATLRALLAHVADHDVRLPDGSPLRPAGVRQLGFQLGALAGARVVAEVLERPFVGDGAARRLSYAFLDAMQRLRPFHGSPIYAALHEPIYAQGEATAWAAQRALDERLAERTERGAGGGETVPWLSAEMVFPWHFEDVVPLRPWRGGAQRLARAVRRRGPGAQPRPGRGARVRGGPVRAAGLLAGDRRGGPRHAPVDHQRVRARRHPDARRARVRAPLGHAPVVSGASQRVVVVGAGVVGLCVAEALAREGHDVRVVERGPRERDGASFGNAGLIVPSHVVPLAAPGVLGRGIRWLLDPESPFTIRPRLDLDLVRWGVAFLRAATPRHVTRSAPLLRDLHLRSKALHLALAERLGAAPTWPRCAGALVVCASAHALEEERALARRAGELGLRAEVLDAAGVAERLDGPEVRCVGGVHYLDDAHASPAALMRALQGRLETSGVGFLWEADVVGFERRDGRVVGLRLGSGEVVGGTRFVLAGGVGSARLARALGAYVPLQAGRGYSVTVPDARVPPALPLLLAEARVAVTPLPEGVRVGGTMEIADPARPVDPRRVRGIARSTERYLPGFDAERLVSLPVWTGARPVSADGMPYLGPLRRAPEVVVAAGHGMMGFSLAPVTGALVADAIAGRAGGLDLTPLAPERFGGHGGR